MDRDLGSREPARTTQAARPGPRMGMSRTTTNPEGARRVAVSSLAPRGDPGAPAAQVRNPRPAPGGDGGRPATGRRPVTVPSAPAGSSPRPPGLGMGQGRDRRDGRAALVGDAPGCLASSVGAPAAPPPLMPHRQPVAGVLAGDGLGRHEVGFGTGTLAGTPV